MSGTKNYFAEALERKEFGMSMSVPAELVCQLYDAIDELMNDGFWVGGCWVSSNDAVDVAEKALKKARGESWPSTQ